MNRSKTKDPRQWAKWARNGSTTPPKGAVRHDQDMRALLGFAYGLELMGNATDAKALRDSAEDIMVDERMEAKGTHYHMPKSWHAQDPDGHQCIQCGCTDGPYGCGENCGFTERVIHPLAALDGVSMRGRHDFMCTTQEALDAVITGLRKQGFGVDTAHEGLNTSDPGDRWIACNTSLMQSKCESCGKLIETFDAATPEHRCEHCGDLTRGNYSDVLVYDGAMYYAHDPRFPLEVWYNVYLVAA